MRVSRRAGKNEPREALSRTMRAWQRRKLFIVAALMPVWALSGCIGKLDGSKPATQAAIQFTPSSLNFGNVIVGKKVTQSVAIKNSGVTTLSITEADLSGKQFSLSGITFPFSLVSGSTANLSVSFTGSSTGTSKGNLTLVTNSGAFSAPVSLVANAVPPGPQLGASPASVGFGNVTTGTTVTSSVTLTNAGGSDLNISVITLNGAEFGVGGITTPRTISAGQSATINVSFSPTSTGSASGSLSINSNDPQSPAVISLTGTGTTSPVGRLALNPGSLAFGNVTVGSNSTLSSTVTNSGQATVHISQVSSTGTGITASGLAAGSTIAAGQSAALQVRYGPAAAGNLNGSVTIVSDASASPTVLSLTGAGVSVTPPSASITAPAAGSTVSGTVNVTASATASAGVANVQFQLDGANVGAAETSGPYVYSWDTTKSSNGSHALTAIVTDVANNKATSSSVSVTVKNGTPDTTPPTVSITAPVSGSTVSGTVTLSANASDNVAVASVQFRVDGNSVGSPITSAPYTYSLNTGTLSNGNHSLTALAKDTSGNAATSAAVTIVVNNAANTTPPAVSITSPANGATVGGTISVTASASDSVGVTGVQFLLDGATLGSKVTSSPYSVLWNTNQVSGGTHILSAQAFDQAGNTGTSSNVAVTVSESNPPPPPPAVGDQLTISDASGLGQANRAVSIARSFVQGEIPSFAQASIGGTALLTQCDVKNRWPDGSLKFAIVSFVVPSVPVNGSVVVSFANQTTGNNTGFLVKSDMLASAYNFDGQIQVSGAANHNISARAMLNAASSCASPSTDPDGTIGANLCTYWLQGPIVTAVILEDRASRSFDVNTDGGSGNPLHPRFEAWFYPSTNQVQLGFTLEDIWASATAASSARDQVLNSVVLTGGNANPATEFSNGAFTMITRSMFHKTYCINGANAGAQFDCLGSTLHIDHNWAYLADTKVLPHWDPTLKVLPLAIASEYSSLFGNAAALPLQGCPVSACVGGSTGIAGYPTALDATGASPHHGIVPTWDTFYLMTQCDAGNSTSAVCGNGSRGDMKAVMLTNADLAGRIPYWFREADTNAGHGQTFDNSGIPGNVQTLGRVVSINARTQISLEDVTASVNSCNTNYPADYINYGGSGQDLGGWDTDTGHWPNIAYASYLTTGQYHYYETQMMQSANALGNSPGTRACTQPTQNGSLRMGSLGYWYVGDERGTNWTKRENLYGAFLAVDGSPEKAYFLDKLNANLAIEEALHGIPNDVGSNYAAAYSFGQTNKCNGIGYCPGSLTSPLGLWNAYNPAYAVDGQLTGTFFQNGSGKPFPQSGDSNFQAAFSGVMVGIAYDMGFTSSALLQFTSKRYIHLTQDPSANVFTLADYVFPTTDVNGNWFTSYSAVVPYYASYPTHWPGIGGGTCQGGDEPYDLEGLAAFSYGYALSDGGFSASAGWNTMRSQLQPCWSDRTAGYGFPFDPKWDITPRANTGTSSPTLPTVSITTPTSGAAVSGTITSTASAASSLGIASVQFNIDGSKFGSAVTAPPYSQSIATAALSNGQHTLTATATDTSNNQATSAAVAIAVNNAADTTPPTVPTGLTVTSISSSLVNLLWAPSTDNVGVTGYDVFRNGALIGTAVGTTYQDTGLTASTSYSYSVAAFDAAGNVSGQSASSNVTTLAASGAGIPSSLGWFEVANSTLQIACPPNNYGSFGYDYPGSCKNVVNAWGGAVADTKRNRLVIWGGGHVDYAGNEIYAFDLNTLQMDRLNNPSPPNATASCVETLADGTPNSRHTYGNLAYMANLDKMFVHGGSLNDCGNFSSATWVLDMTTLKWQNMNPTGGSPAGVNITDYDPGSQLVYLEDGNQLWSYNYQTNAYNVVNNNTPLSYLMSGVIDPKREIFFMFGGVGNPGGGLKAIPIGAGVSSTMQDWTSAVSSTCAGLIGTSYPGLSYDPVQDRIVGWPNFGNTVYIFDPDTKSCTTQTLANGPENSAHSGSPDTSNGTNGRLRYFPAFGVFALVNDGQINVHTLRMTPAN